MKKTLTMVLLVVTLLTTLTGCGLQDKVEAKLVEHAGMSLRKEVDEDFMEEGWSIVGEYDNGKVVRYQATENGFTLDCIMDFTTGGGQLYINGELVDDTLTMTADELLETN
jgi:major membrane immunogen (membrane-anchored lipoprotein)